MKWTLSFSLSLIFVFGFYLFTFGTIVMVGVEGLPTPSGEQPSLSQPIKHYQDRFPSLGSGTVTFIFGCLIMFNAGLGITAITLEHPAMIDSFGYSSFISCFIKFLFIFATIQMHAFNYNYNPLANAASGIAIGVAVFEIALGLAACQLAKVIKRGDAAEPKIQPWPGKV